MATHDDGGTSERSTSRARGGTRRARTARDEPAPQPATPRRGGSSKASGRRRATPAGAAAEPRDTRPRPPRAPELESRPDPGRTAPPPLDSSGWRSGLGTLLRGPGGVLGQISGIEGPARSLDRLAAAAERTEAMLERVEGELGLERLVEALDNLQRLTVATEEMRDLAHDMRRGIREIEERVVDLHIRISPPLDRLPMARRRGAKRTPEEAAPE